MLVLEFALKIDVRTASDAAEGFAFSKRTGVPLVIKNSGVSLASSVHPVYNYRLLSSPFSDIMFRIANLPETFKARFHWSEQCAWVFGVMGEHHCIV